MDTALKALPLLTVFVKIQRKNNKDYSFPAQKTILELIDKYHNIKKSKATLNRWLRVVEDKKYVVRRRRIKRHPVYGLMFKSTLYKITIKGLRLLSRFGVDVSKEVSAFEKWLEEINPKLKNERIKKEFVRADRAERHEENMADIVSKLEKLHVNA